jgi:hypothetical protein
VKKPGLTDVPYPIDLRAMTDLPARKVITSWEVKNIIP